MSAMLDAALRYARHGWHVHPLHTINKLGACTCGKKTCTSPGKHPQTPNGLHDATVDVETIGRWDHLYGEDGWNVGIRTGADSGLLILDVDPDKGGRDTYRKLVAEHEQLPLTPSVVTGGGGMHYYFRHPGDAVKTTAGVLGPGLDIRAEGGYVVAPPSRHVSGNLYGRGANVGRLADIPSWLLDKLAQPRMVASVAAAAGVDRKYVPGQRGTRIRELFGKLNSEGLPLDVIKQAILAENEATFDPPKSEADLFAEIDVQWQQYNHENGQGPAKRGGRDRQVAAKPDPENVGTLLADVEPERIDWRWYGRLAAGKVAILDGDPGLGKSVFSIDISARVSTGSPWPDGTPCRRGGVVICSAEDGLADTIRPRLDAAGGDPSCVVALDLVGEDKHPLTLPDDLSYVEAAVQRVSATVVIIDPLMAFLAGGVNSHRDQDVRRALRPLKELAERTGVAVLVIRHLNKTAGGPVIYRGGGSIGIIGAARIGLVVGLDPEDDERHVLALAKKNLTRGLPSLAYRIENHAAYDAAVIRWEGTSDLTAEQLIAAQVGDDSERSAEADAEGFLRELLADGPVDSQEVKAAARKAGVAERTLWRAKAALGVETHKLGFAKGDPWQWSLPAFSARKSRSVPFPGIGRERAGLAENAEAGTAYRRPDDIDPCPSCGKREGYDEGRGRRTCADCGHQWEVPT